MQTISDQPTKPVFPNDKKLPEHKLTHNGQLVFTGTADNCYMKLQRCQSSSADRAIKYEGWKVEPTGNEIDDPRITVKIIKHWCNTVLFEYRGEQYEITQDAVYGYGKYTPGQIIDVDSTYARKP